VRRVPVGFPDARRVHNRRGHGEFPPQRALSVVR